MVAGKSKRNCLTLSFLVFWLWNMTLLSTLYTHTHLFSFQQKRKFCSLVWFCILEGSICCHLSLRPGEYREMEPLLKKGVRKCTTEADARPQLQKEGVRDRTVSLPSHRRIKHPPLVPCAQAVSYLQEASSSADTAATRQLKDSSR